MVLIISEENDRTTDEVIQWLLNYNINLLRINKEDDLKIICINPNSGKALVEINGNVYDLNTFNTVWYRRGYFNPSCIKTTLVESSLNQDKAIQIGRFLNREWSILQGFLFHTLENKRNVLGNFLKSQVNKLINLKIAKECGLQIPETNISCKGHIISSIVNKTTQISKPISESETFYDTDGSIFKMLTIGISAKDIDESAEMFPTLIQQQISKWFEIRVFFLGAKYYSMAIFSQSSSKTNIDFRNYDDTKPNRMVPFILPKIVERKLKKFTKRLELNTGSIDMIVTPNREFVFLEVNPVGNIEMVSKNCNYPIEQDIANYLCYGNI